MRDAERWWSLGVGIVGLMAFAGGSRLADAPRVGQPLGEVLEALARRRASILAGSVLAVTGSALLLLPVAFVATSGAEEVWPSRALFSIATWVLGFAFLALAATLVITVAWRGPVGLEPSVARLLWEAAHLATWAVSAPVGAVSVVATTAVGLQAGLVGPLVVTAAVAKVVTVAVELAGIGNHDGWNAGGWAAGSSAYATVAWFGLLLVSLP